MPRKIVNAFSKIFLDICCKEKVTLLPLKTVFQFQTLLRVILLFSYIYMFDICIKVFCFNNQYDIFKKNFNS
jgi:hypothetical protein